MLAVVLLASYSSAIVSTVTGLPLPPISIIAKFRIGIDRGKVTEIDISIRGDVGVVGEDRVHTIDCDVWRLRLLRYYWSLYFMSQQAV